MNISLRVYLLATDLIKSLLDVALTNPVQRIAQTHEVEDHGKRARASSRKNFFTRNGVFWCILSGIFVRAVARKILNFRLNVDLVDVKDVRL